jgi:DNA-binding NtrC family response regulator
MQIANVPVVFDVVVTQGPDAGAKFMLEESSAKVLVGTSPLCELRLSDPTVSRRHVSMELAEHGILLTDLGSTNGSFINDTRVMAAFVSAGDRIRLGSTVLQATAREGEARAARSVGSFGRMASTSPRMLNVFALCGELAPTDVPIVLEGETGTGKELLAECIHDRSTRAERPFVVLDCRSTLRGQVETHLFGEVRADGTTRPGIFELANGGTLFIDEPGDMDPEVQAKLLRALDKRDIVRVGETAPIHVDARIVVATCRDLDKLVEEGKFREDLYYRLAGARVEIPPLRRRREDIPLLAAELWTELGGRGFLPAEFMERYEAYDWPGNVRELQRAVERLLALGDKVALVASRSHRHATPPELAGRAGEDVMQRILKANLGYSEARLCMLEAFERAYLEKALADNAGNVAAAAAASGIARRHFQRLRARQK